ncbi:hypothetical protein ACT2CR_00095 [Candidatus Vidania fulgoroideorum]
MKFIKMNSYGNDFVICKNYKKYNIKKITNRFLGIGCDQIIFFDINNYYINCFIYNNDGSLAYNCCNGLRSLSKYLMYKRKINKLILYIKNNKFFSYIKNNKLILIIKNINLKLRYFNYKRSYILNYNYNIFINFLLKKKIFFSFIKIGNNHIIFYKKMIIKNINSNISCITKNKYIKTYERGVGYTNSCGSATCATSIVIFLSKNKKITKLKNKFGKLTCLYKRQYILNIGNSIFSYKGTI